MIAGARHRIGAGILVAATALAGCGIRDDSSPRIIVADSELGPEGAGDAGAASDRVDGATVYLLSPQSPTRLRPVRRDITGTLAPMLDSLLQGLTTTDQSERLRTAIPSTLAFVEPPALSNTTAVLNVDDSIFDATGTALLDALSQIVFTASEAPGVDAVRILVEGAPQEWPTGDGTLSAESLTVFDYPERNPSTQPALPFAAPTESASG